MILKTTSSTLHKILTSKYVAPTTMTLGGAVAFATSNLGSQASKQSVCTYSSTAIQNLAMRRLAGSRAYGGGGIPSSTSLVPRFPTMMIRSTPLTTKATTTTATTTTTTTETTKTGFLAWYEKHLEATPVITKMITGSILWGLGDAVGQTVPQLMFGDDAASGTSETQHKPYDYARTGRAVFYGFAIHAPCSHLHYNFLEWMTVKGGFTGLKIPIFKAFMEQFVYWSWFSNALYHGAMGAMQNMTVQQVYDRIADVLWETQKAQWVFWIPVQLLNFQFVPVRHQLNVVLITSVAWTALLSAWYPPTEEDTKETKKD